MVDNVTLRPFQGRIQQSVQTHLLALRSMREAGREPTAEEKTISADVAPGSGKSLGILNAANEAFRAGEIDALVVFTPRRNLCQQLELDWEDYRKFFAKPSMGSIAHRDNDLPFLRSRSQFGYCTTYQSLVASPGAHLDFFKKHRVMLVGDEAQMLGYDGEMGTGTKSAECFLALAEAAHIVLIMSGTPTRADGARLLLAKYSDPDAEGIQYLQADVSAGYLEGVRLGYLRPVEFQLHDGTALYQYLSGEEFQENISTMSKGLARVLADDRFFGPLVDATVERVKALQSLWPRYCGLIGATDIKHARKILGYLQRRWPHLKALIAVSEDRAAQDNLRAFKGGGYDLLITVGMAHVGFDYRPISVVCHLSAIREPGWNRQFFARGMRVDSTGSPDLDASQCLFAIVPDDPQMREIYEALRRESQDGLMARNSPAPNAPITPSTLTPNPIVLKDIQMTDVRAAGLNPDHDMDAADYQIIDAKRRQHGLLGVSATALKAFLSDMNGGASDPSSAGSTSSTPHMQQQTAQEREAELKKEISRLAKQADSILGTRQRVVPWGYTYGVMNKHFGKKPVGEEELKAAKAWLIKYWLPKCGQKARKNA